MPATVPGTPYAGSPYYNPNSNYGNTLPNNGGWQIGDILQNQQWDIAYDVATRGLGLDPKGAFSTFVRGQSPLVQRAFQAALTKNPNLQHTSFLKDHFGGPGGAIGQMQNTFNALPFQLRGENPTAWGQGAQRWVTRNN